MLLDQTADISNIVRHSLPKPRLLVNRTKRMGQVEYISIVAIPKPHLCRDKMAEGRQAVNGDEFYLPEVCHRGGKWALCGDVSRVARVMVHLGKREQNVTQCLGGNWLMKTYCLGKTSIKASIWMEEWEQISISWAGKRSVCPSLQIHLHHSFLRSFSRSLSHSSLCLCRSLPLPRFSIPLYAQDVAIP